MTFPRTAGRAALSPLLVTLALVTATLPTAPAAGAQEAADTLRSGTIRSEPPGAAPRRQVTAPDSARLDTLVAEVASKLRCPVCRNQSVLESTATLSRQMQSVIREKLAAGQSPEQIKAYFVDKYGEWILLRPEAEGIGLLVYVLPALALLAGGILVFRLLRRWARADPEGGPTAASDAPPGDPEEVGLEHLAPEEREWIRREIGSG